MNSAKLPLFAVLLIAFAASAFSFEVDSVSLHLHILSLTKSKSPEIFENSVIFSYSGPARFVGAVFAHEGFATIHSFEKNKNGVFVYVLPLNPAPRVADRAKSYDEWRVAEAIEYRFVIDGAWTYDRMNPDKSRDAETGITLSKIVLPEIDMDKPGSYSLIGKDGRTVHFKFKGEPEMLVNVCGDFNGWDPFMYELEETLPGVYELELFLGEGTHRYAFFYNGEKVTDPLNPETNVTKDGMLVSVVKIAAR
jgi:hypothetical protein